MRTVTLNRYYLPNKNPRGKPYASSWAMNAEDAAARGAVGIVPGTEKVIHPPENDAERAAHWPQCPPSGLPR